MRSAPSLSEPTKPRQGVGARIARRFGGVVRKAFAALSRPSSPQRQTAAPAARKPHTHLEQQPPRQSETQARPTPAAPPQPARPGWLARCFSVRRRPRPASRRRRQSRYVPFTPETCRGLTAEDCALLNTPLQDCDPEVLRQLLFGLAQHLVAAMPTEAGMPDAKAMFATLWDRLGAPGDATPDETPPVAPEETPAGQQQSTQQTPSHPPSHRTGAKPPRTSAAAIAASETAPDSVVPPRSGRDRRRPVRRFLRHPYGHAVRRTVPDARRRLTVRRLCYASCAGPP